MNVHSAFPQSIFAASCRRQDSPSNDRRHSIDTRHDLRSPCSFTRSAFSAHPRLFPNRATSPIAFSSLIRAHLPTAQHPDQRSPFALPAGNSAFADHARESESAFRFPAAHPLFGLRRIAAAHMIARGAAHFPHMIAHSAGCRFLFSQSVSRAASPFSHVASSAA